MSIFLKPNEMKIKDPSTGQYTAANLFTANSTAAQIAQIEAKGQQTRESIPDDYTALSDEVDALKSAITPISPLFVLRNGSDNNVANTYMVALTDILDYKDATSIKVVINKPLEASTNRYKIRFDTYNVSSGKTNENVINRITKDSIIESNFVYIKKGFFDNTSVGFAFSINEVDSDDNNVTLRITDFGENDVVIIYDYTDASQFANAETQTKAEEIAPIKGGLFDLTENKTTNIIPFTQFVRGSINGNDGSEFGIQTRLRSEFIDVSETPNIEFTIETGYKFLISTYTSNSVSNWQNSGSFSSSGLSWVRPNGITHIKILIANTSDGNIYPIEANNLSAVISNKKKDNTKTDNFAVPFMRNGTVGNVANSNGIATYNIIKIPDRFDYMMLEWTGYSKEYADEIAFAYCVFDGATDGMTTQYAFDNISSDHKHNHNSSFDTKTDTPPVQYLPLQEMRAEGNHFSVAIYRYRSGSVVPLRIADYQYTLKLTYGYFEDKDQIDTGIINLNPNIPDKLLQAKRPLNTSADAYLSVPQPVVLLHFSDIHQSATELIRIVELKNKYSSMIDDAICTGDMVGQRYANGMAWWTAVDGAEDILMAIGNHDALADPTGYDWSQLASQSDQYDQYFSPYISNWGCTYTSDKTYYYKDYSAKKVRLIVLNCMLTGDDDTEQLSWFAETALAGAKTAGYSVVVAVHYMPYSPQKIACNFSSLDKSVGSDLLANAYLNAVDGFVQGGGEFICYIAGHVHYDIFVKSTAYPNQYCICVDALNVNQSNVYSDTQRTNGMKSQDLANLVVIDTASKVVKIIRVGADMDHYLRSKKCMTFKYLTGDIVYQE